MTDLGLVPLIEAAAQAAVQRSLLQTIVPVVRHATVVDIDVDTHIHEVLMDGDTTTIYVHDIQQFGAVPGQRVTVLFAPPHQAMMIGVVRSSMIAEPYGARGQGSASFAASSVESVPVTFGVTFAEIPTILATPRGTTTIASCVVNTDSVTGFVCRVTANAGGSISGTITFNWIALGRVISS